MASDRSRKNSRGVKWNGACLRSQTDTRHWIANKTTMQTAHFTLHNGIFCGTYWDWSSVRFGACHAFVCSVVRSCGGWRDQWPDRRSGEPRTSSPCTSLTLDYSINRPGEGPLQDAVINLGDTVRWFWLGDFHTVIVVLGNLEVFDSGIFDTGVIRSSRRTTLRAPGGTTASRTAWTWATGPRLVWWGPSPLCLCRVCWLRGAAGARSRAFVAVAADRAPPHYHHA